MLKDGKVNVKDVGITYMRGHNGAKYDRTYHIILYLYNELTESSSKNNHFETVYYKEASDLEKINRKYFSREI